MNEYQYTIYYEQDRDNWRKGMLKANSLEEALSKTHYSFRFTPWTIKMVELIKNQ